MLFRSFQTGLPRQKFDRKVLLTAYSVNVRCILEYGTIVWSGAAKKNTSKTPKKGPTQIPDMAGDSSQRHGRTHQPRIP